MSQDSNVLQQHLMLLSRLSLFLGFSSLMFLFSFIVSCFAIVNHSQQSSMPQSCCVIQDSTGMQGHYFDIYVNSARFLLPFPVPQMANIDPLEYQKEKQAKQAQARQQQLQGAASAAERSAKDHSMAREETLAAESGVRQANPVAQATAASTDAKTARPNKKVRLTQYLSASSCPSSSPCGQGKVRHAFSVVTSARKASFMTYFAQC